MSATACVGVEGVAIDRREPVAPAAGGGAALDLAERACSAARSRSFHEVAASASARSSSARSGVGLSLACRASACRAPGRAAESLLTEPVTEVTLPCHACSRMAAKRSLSAASKRSRGANTRQVAKRPTAIAAREQRHAPALLQLQDAERMVVERVLIDLEQLVARIGVEDREQRLAVVAVADRGRSGAALRRPGRAAAARPAPARDRRSR